LARSDEPRATASEPKAPTHDELCARALAGDMAAWNALVQRHNHRVVVSLLGRGMGLDRAKDVAQDAWMRLIEQQREGRLKTLQLPGLAIVQAGFLALETVRRETRHETSWRRHEPIDARPEAGEVPDPAIDAEARLLSNEQLARAEAVLARCSPSARKVFRLVYGNDGGMSHAEVADVVGLSVQRVRQIVCEVRKLLRAAVEGDEAKVVKP
jgi:RNA polymerase sigma-70 factor (ECF subfamily)